jgi:mRNA interferase MazF
MAPKTTRGEVWIVDLGMVAKIRPCLVLSIPNDDDNDRVLTTLIPHTTSTRHSRFEVVIQTPFLQEGAFDTQNITRPSVKLIRRLGVLKATELAPVETVVKQWLGLDSDSQAR